MTRAAARVALLVVAAGLIGETIIVSKQKPARPNVLLIQADDLGYGDLSAYGQSRFSTPSLDRLSREGIRFTEGTTPAAPCARRRARR